MSYTHTFNSSGVKHDYYDKTDEHSDKQQQLSSL
jgi:hypothetical protein